MIMHAMLIMMMMMIIIMIIIIIGKSMAWNVTVVNTLVESILVHLCQSGRCSGAKYSSLPSSLFPHLPTSGFGDSWPYEHNRHRIPI